MTARVAPTARSARPRTPARIRPTRCQDVMIFSISSLAAPSSKKSPISPALRTCLAGASSRLDSSSEGRLQVPRRPPHDPSRPAMKRALPPLLLLSLLALPALSQPPAPAKALKGFDPVSLTQGKEVAGKDDLSVARGRYRYYFASAASKAAFEKDPARYEIQLAGACARMGPLSGLGSPDRF